MKRLLLILVFLSMAALLAAERMPCASMGEQHAAGPGATCTLSGGQGDGCTCPGCDGTCTCSGACNGGTGCSGDGCSGCGGGCGGSGGGCGGNGGGCGGNMRQGSLFQLVFNVLSVFFRL